jgi:probable phosphoglycerate mutase
VGVSVGNHRLVLLRHGETEWSRDRKHTSRTDLDLTDYGREQAELAALTLERLELNNPLVISSPRKRALTTAALAGLTVDEVSPLLAEWDYGDYEGLRTDEIRAVHPNWDVWEDGCPGGETPAGVCQRADHLIARLADLTGKVALFSHGQFGRVLAARWIGLAVAQGQHFAIDPASIGILSFESDHPHRRVISLWNATGSGGLRE